MGSIVQLLFIFGETMTTTSAMRQESYDKKHFVFKPKKVQNKINNTQWDDLCKQMQQHPIQWSEDALLLQHRWRNEEVLAR
jgi:hypothetical protein